MRKRSESTSAQSYPGAQAQREHIHSKLSWCASAARAHPILMGSNILSANSLSEFAGKFCSTILQHILKAKSGNKFCKQILEANSESKFCFQNSFFKVCFENSNSELCFESSFSLLNLAGSRAAMFLMQRTNRMSWVYHPIWQKQQRKLHQQQHQQ